MTFSFSGSPGEMSVEKVGSVDCGQVRPTFRRALERSARS
jgi:hypothetical protein